LGPGTKRTAEPGVSAHSRGQREQGAPGCPLLPHQLERTIALVVLGQILGQCKAGADAPALAAVKGGTAMRLRFGPDGSRFSKDFDVARHSTLDEFTKAFGQELAVGWGGFTGELVPSRSVSRPVGVPTAYVMASYNVRLRYKGPRSPFMTVVLEVSADELEDTVETQPLLDQDVIELFALLGLPTPHPVHVVRDDHQIAQKLHAVSGEGSERAHDLIDLQLLEPSCTLTDAEVLDTCQRLFRFRNAQSWPPTIVRGDAWDTLYAAQVGDLAVIDSVAEAIVWANGYVARLVGASPAPTEP